MQLSIVNSLCMIVSLCISFGKVTRACYIVSTCCLFLLKTKIESSKNRVLQMKSHAFCICMLPKLESLVHVVIFFPIPDTRLAFELQQMLAAQRLIIRLVIPPINLNCCVLRDFFIRISFVG